MVHAVAAPSLARPQWSAQSARVAERAGRPAARRGGVVDRRCVAGDLFALPSANWRLVVAAAVQSCQGTLMGPFLTGMPS